MQAYAELEARFRRMLLLRSVDDILHWDAAAVMPSGSAAARAEQLALLKVMEHELLADPAVAERLDEAEAEVDQLDDWQRANLREMRRLWVNGAAVPSDLVDAFSRACSLCERSWRRARPEGDFQVVAPLLEEVLRLVREVAAARIARPLGPDAPGNAYDALLDEHDPGMRSATLDPLFERLASWLPGLLERALEKQATSPAPLALRGPFPAEAQRRLGLRLMARVGFDESRGRLDVSAHPFCGGTPDDVRITTRYDEDDFATGLLGVLHESGHALYQRGLPEAWRYQPVGEPRGMGLHESQSLLIEMQVCRSRPFLEFAAPLIREAFGGSGEAFGADNLYARATRVERGFIRVDADEVTYPAHVILRYRLEKAMVAGDLSVRDLPGAWNEGMKALLGLDVPDHRRGCLQDIHWFDGAFGYFPSYTIGAVAAAQLFQAACQQVGDVEAGIALGDLAPLIAWLREHVHGQGSRLSTPEIIERATGRPLELGPYEAHLERRYAL